MTRAQGAGEAGRGGLRELQSRLDALLPTFPNILADDVPDGPDESDNVELRRWGEPARVRFPPLPHDELGARLGMDFARAAKLSGARFVVLWGQLAASSGRSPSSCWTCRPASTATPRSPPYLVRDEALFGTGQLPKFGEDLFRTTTGHWLIPTAEVPLTNLVAGEILDEERLPLGSPPDALLPLRGRGRGQGHHGDDPPAPVQQGGAGGHHTPEASEAEHERMVGCAEEVLQRLELPYRVVLLCAGDTGFGARKTYDLEVWLPGQGAYREISSCSNCGDFQARRMNARARPRTTSAPASSTPSTARASPSGGR